MLSKVVLQNSNFTTMINHKKPGACGSYQDPGPGHTTLKS